MCRCVDVDLDDLVAPSAALKRGDSLARKTENITGLGAFWNFKNFFTVEGLYGYLISQRRLNKADGYTTENIGVAAFKKFMRFDTNKDIEISRRSTMPPGFAFAR